MSNNEGTTVAPSSATTPAILCPSWCTDTLEEHVTQIEAYEGFVIHHSPNREEDNWFVYHGRSSFPDGRLDPDDPPQVTAAYHGDFLSPDAAERFARAILAAVEEART